MDISPFLDELPLVAILRGIAPNEAVGVVQALFDAGLLCVEIPLNSPQPLESIAAIRKAFDGRMLVGAGTVLSRTDVDNVAGAGAEFVVSPNTDPEIIAATKGRGLLSMPGFFSPSEAFAALAAGADALKLFPADQTQPEYIKALKSVLPSRANILAVGGIDEAKMPAYLGAGATGFGLGGTLYRPGDSPAHVRARAVSLVSAFRAARAA